MDFFTNRYYNYNRLFFVILGQWPYQSFKTRFIRTTIVLSYLGVTLLGQILKLTKAMDFDQIFEILVSLLSNVICTIRYCNCVVYVNEILKQFEEMKNVWETTVVKEEIEILKDYAEESRIYTFFLAVFSYTSLGFVDLISLTPCVLDIVQPLNTTRTRKFLYEAEFFFDTEKYFYPILLHTWITMFFGVTILVATESIFLVYAYHCCSMFKILWYANKINNCSIESDISGNIYKKLLYEHIKSSLYNIWFNLIVYCHWINILSVMTSTTLSAIISKHHNIKDTFIFTLRHIVKCFLGIIYLISHSRLYSFTFIASIISFHELSFFLQFIIVVLLLSISLVQIKILFGGYEALMYVALTSAVICHGFLFAYPAQKILDHSNLLSEYACSSSWYFAPAKAQKLLLIIIRRNIIDTPIIIMNFLPISFNSFGSVIKTSMSYFTVLYSFR